MRAQRDTRPAPECALLVSAPEWMRRDAEARQKEMRRAERMQWLARCWRWLAGFARLPG